MVFLDDLKGAGIINNYSSYFQKSRTIRVNEGDSRHVLYFKFLPEIEDDVFDWVEDVDDGLNNSVDWVDDTVDDDVD